MRGKLDKSKCSYVPPRITPAGAGKTGLPSGFSISILDHPRRCGENSTKRRPPSHCQGSPPQVRGKLKYDFTQSKTIGITPAGAGKTLLQLSIICIKRDHPRRCGENFSVVNAADKSSGSPPQVRGKLYEINQNIMSLRITPAGAGKTRYQSPKSGSIKDHPRRCGENCVRYRTCERREGSPPQVRGKLTSCLSFRVVSRITPAGAGKTPLKQTISSF